MKKKLHRYLFVFSFLALLSSCSKDTFDEYYGRPENLEDPIFQQLEARGNFKNLTALIDKAGYKDILSKSGYWTMMAPNDEAFTKFFQEKGFSDVSKVDAETAGKIVRYALVYNAFREDQLADYQSALGWVPDNAYRRRTAFYDGFITKTIDGKATVTVDSNRNNRAGTGINYFVTGDSNNKYITYFEKDYFAAQKLSAYDYNFFYPNKQYTGSNVLDGTIKEANIIAENGIIHEVTQVSLPLVNLDQYLEQNSQYSLFHDVMEKNLVTYVFNQDATNTYHNYTGKSDNVSVKVWDPALPFSPNNENFLKDSDNDGQNGAYTMFVPDNASFQAFINTVLLKNYPSLDKLPKYVFQDLFKAHVVANTVWPSKVATSNNALDEDVRFNMSTDIKEAKVLSNGFFYGTNKVQASDLFFSVYTSAYLDPKFTLATRLFNDGSGFKQMISNIDQKYTLFLPSDAVLRGLGFDYDINRSEWKYTNPTTGLVEANGPSRFRLLRVLYNGIIPTPNGELNNLSGSGIIRSGDNIIPGEYIKWSNNKVFAAGNEVAGNTVSILGYEDKQNGRTYYINGILNYSEEYAGLKIKRLGTATGSNSSFFYNYLLNSALFDVTTGKIQGVDVGSFYTFIIPSNAAITQAVKNGVLPGTPATGVPNYNPTLPQDKELITEFIRYHILALQTASNDGLTTGLVETLHRDKLSEKTYITVSSVPGTLSFTDNNKGTSTTPPVNRTANFIPASSNNLADRSLIHIVDNYLLYKE
ncbi:fasciclin domain-containing protein [Flavobacterium gilvum]|uniref:FAS1 domain-containing protein n=1 Tax=Flavobacterium gilvum TaxID=1492737 RepID=A0AAC9I4F5_9FLAO|nr:fasciclin domain-containing protein [Flavobacterium gilvum]AOW09935.1 hypothetical protein EM308_10665 [Flavobacterium gilvum]KFC59607.1 hypothetical protein FEM08_15990 [Flavobacterium gilvum]